MRRPLVPVIVGPTAVGKTAVVTSLAELWPLAAVSADARQVYRGLDIGTAKPTREQQRSVRYYGIDLVEPGERYSAGRFAQDAVGWLAEIGDERRPVVVGGTGFYVRALADGLFTEPPMDPDRRNRLKAFAVTLPAVARWAARLDPGYKGGGRQRASRTIEVALLTGRPLTWWQVHAKAEGVMRPWYVRLTLPRAILHRRIAERAERMVSDGLIEEVQGLLQRGVPADAPGLDALGYRETMAHLRGEIPLADLPEAIAGSTRRYARRQETWFRNQLTGASVITLDASESADAIARRIADSWETRGA